MHLEISDRRGTARYTLRPDGRVHSGVGFAKLPIKQKAKWGRDGSLLVEERYAQHLVRARRRARLARAPRARTEGKCSPARRTQGGSEHGTKCSGDACPLIRSRRSVDKASGQMLVEIERTLLDGAVMKTRTYYSAAAEK